MSFRLELPEEEEPIKTEQNEQQSEQKVQEKELTVQPSETEKAKAELIKAQMELTKRRIEHKRALDEIRSTIFGKYYFILKTFPDKWWTISEIWTALRLLFTGKSDKLRVKEEYRLTEQEFYSIFGHYPMTMANNRLYKITFLLKQRPDIEWLQDGRVHKYRYIGVKKSETK